MEIRMISQWRAVDFDHDSTSTSRYATAPSSPQSTIPFMWEDKPGIPKQTNQNHREIEYDTDFTFAYLQRHSTSTVDDLFDRGKIKPLTPPPRLHSSNHSPALSKSPKGPKLRFKDVLSSPKKKNEFDPFSEAFKQTPCVHAQRRRKQKVENNRCKVCRSLSPFQVSGIVNIGKNSTGQSAAGGLMCSNNWNLKNILLFRSASDVTTRKDSSNNKYTMLKKGETVSYKSGLMGCFRFNQNA